MIPKRPHIKFYFLITILIASIQSCEHKEDKKTTTITQKKEIKKTMSVADAYLNETKYDSAYFYYNKVKIASEEVNDTSNIINAIASLATIQQRQGDYAGSETTAAEAFPIIERTNKPNYKWSIYIILANNYLYTNDYQKALYYNNKALQLKINTFRQIETKNNIAVIYMGKKDYLKAIQILESLINLENVMENDETYSRILNNLGYCYFKTGNKKAFIVLEKALKIRIKNNDDWGIISSYYSFSELYREENNRLSNKYALLAYNKATLIKNTDDRLQCLELLIRNNNPIISKKYSLEYLSLNDSIVKIRQSAKNSFAKIKYDSKKEKNENIRLKEQKTENLLQLEIQKNKTTGLYLVIFIILIITLFIYYYLKVKSNREKIQASYKTETQIAKKLHDELANDVYQMMKFAETQDLSTPKNKKILLNSLDTVYDRTRNISKENNTIETGVYFDRNLKMMISDFNTATTSVVINNLEAVDWTKINSTKKISLYRIIQELLVNMKKHSQCSIAVLSFKIDKGKLQLDYTDNGIGLSGISNNKNSGLNNIKRRIKTIKGNIDLNQHSKSGCKINIQFPV